MLCMVLFGLRLEDRTWNELQKSKHQTQSVRLPKPLTDI